MLPSFTLLFFKLRIKNGLTKQNENLTLDKGSAPKVKFLGYFASFDSSKLAFTNPLKNVLIHFPISAQNG
jgi:hypothetical protein